MNEEWKKIDGGFEHKAFDCNIGNYPNMPKELYEGMTAVSAPIAYPINGDTMQFYIYENATHFYTITEYRGNDTGHLTYHWDCKRECLQWFDRSETLTSAAIPFTGGA